MGAPGRARVLERSRAPRPGVHQRATAPARAARQLASRGQGQRWRHTWRHTPLGPGPLTWVPRVPPPLVLTRAAHSSPIGDRLRTGFAPLVSPASARLQSRLLPEGSDAGAPTQHGEPLRYRCAARGSCWVPRTGEGAGACCARPPDLQALVAALVETLGEPHGGRGEGCRQGVQICVAAGGMACCTVAHEGHAEGCSVLAPTPRCCPTGLAVP